MEGYDHQMNKKLDYLPSFSDNCLDNLIIPEIRASTIIPVS